MNPRIKVALFLVFWGISEAIFAVPTLFFGIQPTSLEVSYGAVSKSYSLLFYIVNNAPAPQPLSSYKIAITPPGPHSITNITFQNDCGNVIPARGPHGICNIQAFFNATGNQPGAVKFLPPEQYVFSLQYSTAARKPILTSNPFSITYATGKLIPTATRTLTFKNNCTYPVYLGISAGATNSIHPTVAKDLQSCSGITDCYPGSQCLKDTPTLSHCFWNNPTPKLYLLAALTGNTTAVFPAYDNGIDPIWSGGVAARTNCAKGVCETADCGNATSGVTGACKPAQGFQQPVSTSEFTLQGSSNLITNVSGNTDVDTYDATVINGINVPVSMGPTGATWGGAKNPYVCGTPGAGASTKQTPLGVCSWDFTKTVPLPDYVWVRYQPGAANCLPLTNVCEDKSNVCGLSYNPQAPIGQRLNKKCGVKLGYWTADSICAVDPGHNVAPFYCSNLVQGNLTYADLYGCAKGALKLSCYSEGAIKTCCGCANWNTIKPIIVPPPPITNQCVAQNPNWQNNSQPKLIWLKQGCPTAYTYPYDDASSTFTCSVYNKAKINTANYVVTFCPK